MINLCKETLLGGRKLISLWLCSLALAACTDDDSIIDRTGENNLQVEVSANFHSRAPIHGSTLPDNNPIGVTLTAKDGSSYDNQNYNNIPYSATTADGKQTWMPQDKPVTLSVTEGVAMAYWPYNADAADITAVPVETDTQTDYMYSGNVTGLTNATPKAAFQMKHAMTLIRVNVVRGTYTAEGAVTAVTAASEAFCTSGTMNVSTGALADLKGAETPFLEEPADATITTAGRVTEFLVLPDVTINVAAVTLGVTVDGRKYSTAIEVSEAYKQGYIYTYNLTLDNTALNVSAVTVTPWEEEISVEAPEPVAEDDQYIVQVTIDSDNYTYIHNIVNFVGTIDWGDGTTTTYDIQTKRVSHIYNTAGKYLVVCSGKATGIESYGGETSKDISKLIHIGGEMGIGSMGYAFNNMTKLTEIPAEIFDGLEKVVNMAWCFSGCKGLTGNIPAGLFDKCPNVTAAGGLFSGASNLTGPIPAGLFDNWTKVTNFYMLFSGCSSLTGIIPAGLLDNCVLLENVGNLFASCKNLTGNIPQGFFDKLPKLTTVAGTFDGCNNLTGAIPEGLLKYNTKVTAFGNTFRNCHNLTSIPVGLFDNCPDASNFTGTFYGCSSITEIPEGLFDNNTKVNGFTETFCGLHKLKSIPNDLFKYNINVTTFTGTFNGCKGIAEIPVGLFDNCPEVTTFQSTFKYCTSIVEIPAGLFDNCTEVTNFKGTFEHCYSLSNLPEGLFDNNIKVKDFGALFYYCSNIKSFRGDIFKNNTEVTNFAGTLCGAGITTIPVEIFSFAPDVTSFAQVFWKCNSLTDLPFGIFDNNRKVIDFGYALNDVRCKQESPYTIVNVDGNDVKVHLYERSLYPEHFTAPTKYNGCFLNNMNWTDITEITSAGWN